MAKHVPINSCTSESVFGQETTRTLCQDLPPSTIDTDGYDFCTDVDYDETPHGPTFSSPRLALHSSIKNSSSAARVSRRQRRRGSRPSTTDEKTFLNNDDGAGNRSDSDVSARRIPRQLFACPFYKHNSMRNMNCVRLRLTRVRDVKQHLVRRHRRPIYCPTCGDNFPDSQSCATHIVARTCLRPVEGVHIEGVDESQSIALARRVNRSLDERAQWFSIWDILFPGSEKPSTPYLSNHYEETFGMMKDYWRYHGKLLVTELAGDVHGGPVKHLSSAVVETLLDRFLASSQFVMDPAGVLSRSAAAVKSVQPQTQSLQTKRQPSEKLVDPDCSSIRSSAGYHTIANTTAAGYYYAAACSAQDHDAPSTATGGALLPYCPINASVNSDDSRYNNQPPDNTLNMYVAGGDQLEFWDQRDSDSLDMYYYWPSGDFPAASGATPTNEMKTRANFIGSSELGFDFSAPWPEVRDLP